MLVAWLMLRFQKTFKTQILTFVKHKTHKWIISYLYVRHSRLMTVYLNTQHILLYWLTYSFTMQTPFTRSSKSTEPLNSSCTTVWHRCASERRIESQRTGRKGRVTVLNSKRKVEERTAVSKDGWVKGTTADANTPFLSQFPGLMILQAYSILYKISY